MKTIGFTEEQIKVLEAQDIKYFMRVKKSKGHTLLEPHQVIEYLGDSIWRVRRMDTLISWVCTSHPIPALNADPFDICYTGEKKGFRKLNIRSTEFIPAAKAYGMMQLLPDGTTKFVGTFKYEGTIITPKTSEQ